MTGQRSLSSWVQACTLHTCLSCTCALGMFNTPSCMPVSSGLHLAPPHVCTDIQGIKIERVELSKSLLSTFARTTNCLSSPSDQWSVMNWERIMTKNRGIYIFLVMLVSIRSNRHCNLFHYFSQLSPLRDSTECFCISISPVSFTVGKTMKSLSIPLHACTDWGLTALQTWKVACSDGCCSPPG